MKQEQPVTLESATKTLKHIQKVFYVVGGINLVFLTPFFKIYASLSLVGVSIKIFLALIIIFMGWSLNRPYRKNIPNVAFGLSILLLSSSLIEGFLTKSILPSGLIFPIALWIIAKQAKQAISVLENVKNK